MHSDAQCRSAPYAVHVHLAMYSRALLEQAARLGYWTTHLSQAGSADQTRDGLRPRVGRTSRGHKPRAPTKKNHPRTFRVGGSEEMPNVAQRLASKTSEMEPVICGGNARWSICMTQRNEASLRLLTQLAFLPRGSARRRSEVARGQGKSRERAFAQAKTRSCPLRSSGPIRAWMPFCLIGDRRRWRENLRRRPPSPTTSPTFRH